MEYSFFIIGLGFLLNLQMEAVEQKQRTIFPLISGMGDMLAYAVYTGLHIPFYFFMFYVIFQKWAAKTKCTLY
jgi:hypothetical protein